MVRIKPLAASHRARRGRDIVHRPLCQCSRRATGAILLGLILTASVGSPGSLFAQRPPQSSDAWIEILEPEAWTGEGTRGLHVVARRSIRVVGLAGHVSGIRQVRVNGKRAALEVLPSGDFRFHAPVPVLRDLREVEVAAYPFEGAPAVRTFAIESVEEARELATPDEAWDDALGLLGQRWAVIIGISEYLDERIPDLDYADDDALAFYDFLRSEKAGLGGFDSANVKLLVNEDATIRNIRAAMTTFLRSATEDDLIVVYIAAHGTPDHAFNPDDLYLLAYDSEIDQLSATALPMEEVSRNTSKLRYRNLIVFTDACHSAGVGVQTRTLGLADNRINEHFLQLMNGSTGGMVTFTASQVNELSREGRQWGGGHGAFTHYLLEGLNGAADLDGDRIVNLYEVMEYTRDRVKRATGNQQTPTISEHGYDRFLPMAVVLDEPAMVTPASPEPAPEERISQPITVEQDTVAAQEESLERPTEPPTAQPEDSVLLQPEVGAADTLAEDQLLYNPGQVAFQSLLIPGLGQFTSGRPGRGLFYLVGAAASVTTGLFYQTTVVSCAAPTTGTCPAPDIISQERKKPLMMAGLGVAAALGIISAIDAYSGAKSANRLGAEEERGTTTVNTPRRGRLAMPSVSYDGAVLRIDLIRYVH